MEEGKGGLLNSARCADSQPAEDVLEICKYGVAEDVFWVQPLDEDALVARANTKLERSSKMEEIVRLGEVTINFVAQEATRDGATYTLSALEMDILQYLISHKGRIVSRKQLLRDIWDLPEEIVTRTVDRHIASLRKKIEADSSNPRFIETIYSEGYRFNA